MGEGGLGGRGGGLARGTAGAFLLLAATAGAEEEGFGRVGARGAAVEALLLPPLLLPFVYANDSRKKPPRLLLAPFPPVLWPLPPWALSPPIEGEPGVSPASVSAGPAVSAAVGPAGSGVSVSVSPFVPATPFPSFCSPPSSPSKQIMSRGALEPAPGCAPLLLSALALPLTPLLCPDVWGLGRF